MQSFLQFRQLGCAVEAQIKANRRRNADTRRQEIDRSSKGNDQLAELFSDPSGEFSTSEHFEKTSALRDSSTSDELNDAQGAGSPEGGSTEVIQSRKGNHTFPPCERSATSTATASSTPTQMSSSQNGLAPVGKPLGESLTGIQVRQMRTLHGVEGGEADKVFIVGFDGDDDALNPHNWSQWRRARATINCSLIGFMVGVVSSIDASALRDASAEFGVSKLVESMATGLFLIGFGGGALAAGPLSEAVGRNPVYIVSLIGCMIFIMASGLAPNIGAQLAFRFMAGIFASTPMTCGGGSLADMWDSTERVYSFPIFAIASFQGPALGPVMGGWITQYLDWRWVEWITLIGFGLVLVIVVLTQPETYSGIILSWKASHLRRITGDQRYVGPVEVQSASFKERIFKALYRPFTMTAQEPIVILVALYLVVIYVVLFTFFIGYDYIFGEVHGTSPGITGTCFLGIALGLIAGALPVPLIYHWAKMDLLKKKAEGKVERLDPEFRLWSSMLGGSIALPISLFWMGWTSYPSISIWSPLAASILFGYGVLTVFISTYQYVIDVYEAYAASALAAVTVLRYCAAGGMTIAGTPLYENLGIHWTLTIMGTISALLAPVPYVFYIYGERIRSRSKFAPGRT